MTPQTPLEERLRDTLRRPEGSPWPDGRGAFDRFQRQRVRRGWALAAGTGLALVALLAAAVLLPGVLPRGGAGQIAPVAPAGPVERNPARGFEVPLPDGWSKAEPAASRARPRAEAVLILEKKGSSGTPRIILGTGVMEPRQHPGLPPGEEPGGIAGEVGSTTVAIGVDRDNPLRRGRRADGRPYVWSAPAGPVPSGTFAVAWPYHCAAGRPCPDGNRYRVLLVSVESDGGGDPAERRELLAVARELAETARPITNALPGGNSAQVDPIFTDRGRFVRREP